MNFQDISIIAKKPKQRVAILPTLDQSLDVVLEKFKWEGEDLTEEEYWVEKWWLEVREEGERGVLEIRHLFKASRDYQRVIEGDVYKGRWYFPVKGKNEIEIEIVSGDNKKLELYKRSFLGEQNCFVLQKSGHQVMRGKRKYLPLFNYQELKRYDSFVWTDFIEEIQKEGIRYSNFYRNLVLFIVATGIAIMLLSSFN